MSKEADEFLTLIQQVRDGSQSAAWELVTQYSPQIFRIVRRRMPDGLRNKFDSEDFVQATWASIFAFRSRIARFDHPQKFVAFVGAVAMNKLLMEIRRRFKSQKHNVRVERSLEGLVHEPLGGATRRQPTPSEIAVARERWFQILDNQPPHYQRMIRMRYDGFTFQDIADQLGFDERTVRRVLRKVMRDNKITER